MRTKGETRLITIIILLIAGLAINTLSVFAAARMTVDCARSLEQASAAQYDEVILQNEITRKYLVTMIEGTLLPHLGYKPPERSDIEKQMIQECSEFICNPRV